MTLFLPADLGIIWFSACPKSLSKTLRLPAGRCAEYVGREDNEHRSPETVNVGLGAFLYLREGVGGHCFFKKAAKFRSGVAAELGRMH